MKKTLKVALLSSLAVVGVASMAACGGSGAETGTTSVKSTSSQTTTTSSVSTTTGTTSSSTTTSAQQNLGDVDVSILYTAGKGKTGVTYQLDDAYTLPYGDGATLTKNTLLPTWKAFGQNLNMNIREGNDYSHSKSADDWTTYMSDGYKFGDNYLDLVMGSQTEFTKAVNNTQLVAISDHLDQMPNFKAWAKANSGLYNSIKQSDGKVYFTPYFDGMDDIESMNIMNTDYTKKLLDEVQTGDSTTLDTHYSATIPGNSSVASSVSYNGVKKNITVNYAAENNAITKQNALTTKSGANLLAALKEALIAEYGAYISTAVGGQASPADAMYQNLSDIFVSEQACYNVDDLVALLRAVKANAQSIIGTEGANIVPFTVRTAQGNRVFQLGYITSWWGVRGPAGENSSMYFDANEELQSAYTDSKFYDCLDYLHEMYQEGLIEENFVKDSKGTDGGKTEFRSARIKDGSAFMLYDFNTSTAVFNADYLEGSKSNVQAVLPPVCDWLNGGEANVDADTTASGYFHFTEDNRSLKSGGWAIPATCDNLDGAFALMDYMFSEEGSVIQDFGPATEYTTDTTISINGSNVSRKAGDRIYWNDPDGSCVLSGVDQPIITDEIIDAIKTSGLGWNDYYRTYIGSTQGIGHVRHGGLDYENLLSAQGVAGLAKVEAAISSGGLILAKNTFSDDTNKFFNSVPSSIALSSSAQAKIDAETSLTKIEDFWKHESSTTNAPFAWVIIGGWDDTHVTDKRAALEAIFTTYDSVRVQAYRDALADAGI